MSARSGAHQISVTLPVCNSPSHKNRYKTLHMLNFELFIKHNGDGEDGSGQQKTLALLHWFIKDLCISELE